MNSTTPPNNNTGRAAGFNPPNRFGQQHFEPFDLDFAGIDPEDVPSIKTIFMRDTSKSVLAKNDSPDVPFTYSINPYRGCEHGCIYCYARPSHEYLGFSAGLDFETKILVKEDAPLLLAREFRKKSWWPEMVCFSGNTDCYQPVERKLEITRRCLAVFLDFRNPVGIITKNFLVTRDLDILSEMAKLNLVTVSISITSLRPELTRMMEPRTSMPEKRFEAIELLAKAGIPTHVNVAPIVPGLTDEEIPAILREAAARGATSAGYIMMRLPGPVEPLFVEWVERMMPERASKILNRVRDVRGGKLTDARFGKRMKGEGEIADSINKLFKIHRDKYGLNRSGFDFALHHFRKVPDDGQGELF